MVQVVFQSDRGQRTVKICSVKYKPLTYFNNVSVNVGEMNRYMINVECNQIFDGLPCGLHVVI